MSGVYINMEMPSGCVNCPLNFDATCNLIPFGKPDETNGSERRPDCPLLPVPDHGRLVDADALITTFCEWGTRLERGRKLVITMSEAKQEIVDIIEDAQTILPGEEAKERKSGMRNA